ncbi:hypothetical protein AVEN_683-1 [Araneus ventricosus]|uniref:Uncharacterized protein n=1 Tax=Araneus ventricosus TaxID=182803 RepID=A0A4Y2BU54_ARAVE|nr:hypothetical protein AVEN_683-1 [Araneus ventricosus]
MSPCGRRHRPFSNAVFISYIVLEGGRGFDIASRTDVLFHDISGFIEHNGAATSTIILSLPGPSKPVADEQMEVVRAILENDSSTITSLIQDFPKTTASQDILKETSPLPSSSNKDRKKKKSVQVKKIKTDYTSNFQRRLENESKNGTKI